MNSLLLALGSITALFVLFLVGKTMVKKEFCAVCAAVSVTWIGLLILYYIGSFSDTTLIAILLGQTVVGIFYVVEKKVPSSLTVFRLPFLLTLTVLGYFLLSVPEGYGKVMVFLLFLWIFFIGLYVYNRNKVVNKLVRKIIDCCKKW